MKQELSAIEIRVIVAELQGAIGSRIDQVYSLGEREVLLQLRKSGAGKQWIRIGPRFIWMPLAKPVTPEKPSGFCALLRKSLSGAKVLAIAQEGAERAVSLRLGRKEGEFSLVAEFFAKGNVLLCDSAGKILGLLEEQHVGGRELKRGSPYVSPAGADSFSMGASEFETALKESADPISRSLATRIGVGGAYAAEVCARAGIDPQLTRVPRAKLLALHKALTSLLVEKPSPVIVLDGGAVVDAAPWPLRAFEKMSAERVSTFSEAIDRLVAANEAKLPPPSSAADKKRQKLEKTVAQQEEAAAGLEKKAGSLQQAGEICYAKHAELQSLMDDIKAARKKGLSKEEILKMFKQKGLRAYDPATLEIEIDAVG